MSQYEHTHVEVRGNAFPESVEALVREGLAVHAGIGSRCYGWTVTHAASGIAVRQDYPSPFAAMAAVDALLPLLDWRERTVAEILTEPYKSAVIETLARVGAG